MVDVRILIYSVRKITLTKDFLFKTDIFHTHTHTHTHTRETVTKILMQSILGHIFIHDRDQLHCLIHVDSR